MASFRKLEGEEIDALYEQAELAVQSFRDTRNSNLKLAPINECEDCEEALSCPLYGVNAVDDLGLWTKKLQRAFHGSRLAQETSPNGTMRYTLVLPKFVEVRESANVRSGTSEATQLHRPSTDRAMLLVVLLVILVAMLWARL
jgi:hypothetical protein